MQAMMTSRSLRCSGYSAALFAALTLVAACGGAKPAPSAPATSTTTSEPTAPADPAAPAAGAPAAAAKPTTPGPNQTPDGIVFNFKPDRKGKVFLAGNFNDWNPANEKYVLTDEDGDGMFSITVKLMPGSYQYKYVIEGQWIKDPSSPSDAPDGFGGRNGKFDVK
jgi:Glycogen recognition site of AMP-activated protein kinase